MLLAALAAPARAGLAFANGASKPSDANAALGASYNTRDDDTANIDGTFLNLDIPESGGTAARDGTRWIYLRKTGGGNDAFIDIRFDLGKEHKIDRLSSLQIWQANGAATRVNAWIVSRLESSTTTYELDITPSIPAFTTLTHTLPPTWTQSTLSFDALDFDTLGTGGGTKLSADASGFYSVRYITITIRLNTSAGNSNFHIDAVGAVTTPEPGTTALFALGLVVLGGTTYRRRRRRRTAAAAASG